MKNTIEDITERIIFQLYNQGQIDKAALSSLRRSISITSKQATCIWPLFLTTMDREDLSKDGHPTHAEIAIFTAVRCYAIYQQANEKDVFAPHKGKKKTGLTLFEALSKLRQDNNLQKALDRRVESLLASTEINNVVNGIVHLLEILKSHYKYLQIDYSLLAQDLFRFQFGNASAREVSLTWGEQYFNQDKNKK